MRRALLLVVLLASLALAAAQAAAPAPGAAAGGCPVTLPNRASAPTTGPEPSARGFNHGDDRLRAHLYWPRGVVRAGPLPDGGVMATVEPNGAVSLKLGWWRGAPGRLVVTGRRLDGPAPPVHAHVPSGYGRLGFQPAGVTFRTVGCWRVTGRVGAATLSFVLRVTKLPQ